MYHNESIRNGGGSGRVGSRRAAVREVRRSEEPNQSTHTRIPRGTFDDRTKLSLELLCQLISRA